MQSRLYASLAILGLLAIACQKGHEAPDPSANTAPGGEPATSTASKSVESNNAQTMRNRLQLHRSLGAEAHRAEISWNGPWIDLGDNGQHKYTRAGWGTNWSDPNGESAQVTGPHADLFVPVYDPGVTQVRVRIRSKLAGQTLRIDLGNHKSGSIALSNAYKEYHFDLPETLALGRHKIRLAFEKAGTSKAPAADVDWLWLSSKSKQQPHADKAVQRIDSEHSTLPASGQRTYAYYIRLPENASLVTDINTKSAATFSVSVRSDQNPDQAETILQKTYNKAGHGEETVDLKKWAGQRIRLELASSGSKETAFWGEPAIMIPKTKAPPMPKARAKNLIFVLMDTTRYDMFGPFGGKAVKTPVFDRFAKGATVFQSAYNNENWTKPSVTTLLSGLYPLTHTNRESDTILPEDVTLISQHLQKNGFKTGAFISNAVVNTNFGFNKGWDTFNNYSRMDEGAGEFLYPTATKWLKENHDKGRFFLYIQSVDPHTTYDVDKKYSSLYYKGDYKGSYGPSFEKEEQFAVSRGSSKVSKDDMDWIWALYKGEVTYQDEHIGGLLTTIKKLGLEKDTIVVITNDHGEEFRDHGRMGHGWTLYDEMIRSPLAIQFPPLFPAGKAVTETVEHVDVPVTLLESLGLPPLPEAEGQSLLPLIHDQPSLRYPWATLATSRNAMRSAIAAGHKLIVGETADYLRLYDLEEDPLEKKDIKDKRPITARLVEIQLAEISAIPDKTQRRSDRTTKKQHSAKRAPLDDDTKKMLEEMGYLGETPH